MGHWELKSALTASLVATACLSCASSFEPAEVTGATSGARLRAWVEEGGGVRLFDGWHDTALELDCEFKTATDGQLRCLPLWSRATVLYADRDCVTPIFAENWSAEPPEVAPRWAITGSAGAAVCGGTVGTVVTEVHALGDAIPTPAPETEVYFRAARGSDASCSPARAPSPRARYYALGAIEAPEGFVAAARVVEARAGLFDQSVTIADDGAREAAGFFARAWGAVCSPLTIREQERCVFSPIVVSLGLGVFFADAACAVPVGIANRWSEDSCGPPRLFLEDDFGTECLTRRVYEVGDVLTTRSVATTDGCVETSGSPGYFGRGPELTGSALDAVAPPLTRARIGTGALRASFWVDADGAPLMPTYYPWQMADGTPCTPREHAGARVCGPAAEAKYYFADAACSVPLISPIYFCADPLPTVVAVPSQDAFREVGADYTGTDVYVSLDGSTCTAGRGPFTTGYHTLGPITTRTFPTMRRRLD